MDSKRILPLLLSGIGLASSSPLVHTRNATCSASTSSSDPGPGYEYHTVGTQNGTWPWQVYKSSNFTPPEWQINKTGETLAPGFILVTTSPNPETPQAAKQQAATIFTDEGQLVWSSETGTFSNLAVSKLDANDVLVFTQSNEGNSCKSTTTLT